MIRTDFLETRFGSEVSPDSKDSRVQNKHEFFYNVETDPEKSDIFGQKLGMKFF